jgi:hypothetical protein
MSLLIALRGVELKNGAMPLVYHQEGLAQDTERSSVNVGPVFKKNYSNFFLYFLHNMYKDRTGPRHVDAFGKLIIWCLFKPIFFKYLFNTIFMIYSSGV